MPPVVVTEFSKRHWPPAFAGLTMTCILAFIYVNFLD
jgi:hypothetical protein